MRKIIHPRIISQSPHTKAPVLTVLDNGHVLVLSDAATDADGAPNFKDIDEKHGQLDTSLRRSRGWKVDGEFVNALTIPYFVLPGNWKKVTGISCGLGDIAKLSFNGNFAYTIYADVGDEESIGEASVRAIEALGGNPWLNHKVVHGIDYGVTYEIIPGSAKLEITRTFDEIQQYGRALFP
ncbi:glycoside hydrolase family 75 protein [Pseudomonas synxantha]|uniref:Uncharacterized protein n=1 Tax=Pseudomonas synxantha TaxID=47883 RepID=A0ACC6JS36_9PSED|nr:glycoside hydrolase family 75 protein [Pseudomonas synxantha]MDR6609077.1 hypothetical protein [Pseudomonas synxantha]